MVENYFRIAFILKLIGEPRCTKNVFKNHHHHHHHHHQHRLSRANLERKSQQQHLSTDDITSTTNEKDTNNNNKIMKQNQYERMSFQDMIIFTIQRFPQYNLFLSRLIAITPKNHNDYESLQQAKEKLNLFLDRIGRPDQTTLNTPQKQRQQPQRPITIQIKDLPTLVDETQWICNQYPSDCLVYIFDNVLIRKHRKQQDIDGALFVLSDSLLLAERINNNRNKRRSFSHEYRLHQMVAIENLDLRCQCWQRNGLFFDQQQQPSSMDATIPNMELSGPIYNCPGCIDTLQLDVQKIYELQSLSTEIETLPIRRPIERTFNNYLLLIVKQLAEMKESLYRCTKDCSVDLFVIQSPTLDRNFSINNDFNGFNDEMDNGTNTDTNIMMMMATHQLRSTHYKCELHRKLPSSPDGGVLHLIMLKNVVILNCLSVGYGN
ncbi:hypothetical protein BLA29_005208 [Euroglyphus maynei]|uniref:DH domain-containing protein n=1 Tax=Euroglyphus maynei TaxID=6958 RepID=A0A1Y3B679_EURMA|nr:hypothetical protein BLA29_005208 [Euroglyphus maynei]